MYIDIEDHINQLISMEDFNLGTRLSSIKDEENIWNLYANFIDKNHKLG